jgi:hypothetical protein
MSQEVSVETSSVLSFVTAVADHWVTLVTGGLIIAALAVWERVRRQIPLKAYAVILVGAFFVACYQAWSDERENNIRLQQVLNSQHFQVMDFALKKYARSTKYSLNIIVRNSGPQAASTPVLISHDPIFTTVNLTDTAIKATMDDLETEARGKILPHHSINQIEPEKTTIITVAPDFITEEQISDVKAGKLGVYVFGILRYRDNSMSPNHSRVTIYGVEFAGGFDYRHNVINEVVDWD